MSPARAEPSANRLLAALPRAVWQRWGLALNPVQLKLGQVLFESGCIPSHVYFPTTAVVQSAGAGYRLNAPALRCAFDGGGAVPRLLLRYAQALTVQICQTALCNRHHSLDQQLCRWLLAHLDRLDGSEIVMTQERIANMLGVRREGVTASALKLQNVGLIRYSRGHIHVLDRQGLEARTCECYAAVRREYDRLLPATGMAA